MPLSTRKKSLSEIKKYSPKTQNNSEKLLTNQEECGIIVILKEGR